MRLRRRQPDDPVPQQLQMFDPADWPEGDFGLWREARRIWRERYGWPHQDPLEFLQDERRQRLAAFGMPDPNAVPTRPQQADEPADDDAASYFLERFREWSAMPSREDEG